AAVGAQVLEQADAHHGEAGGGGGDAGRRVDGVPDGVDHHGPVLERTGPGAEDQVQRPTAVSGDRRLDAVRGQRVGVGHVLAGRGQHGGAGDLDQEADRRDDARGGEEQVVLLERLGGEVVDELDSLVAE